MDAKQIEKIDLNKKYIECGITGELLRIELKPNDYYSLLEQIEQLESEKETLMMSHDNLNRELVDYKRLNQKDKHELIKANISKIRKIEKLQEHLQDVREALGRRQEQNKRYREALQQIKEATSHNKYWKEIAFKALENEE